MMTNILPMERFLKRNILTSVLQCLFPWTIGSIATKLNLESIAREDSHPLLALTLFSPFMPWKYYNTSNSVSY